MFATLARPLRLCLLLLFGAAAQDAVANGTDLICPGGITSVMSGRQTPNILKVCNGSGFVNAMGDESVLGTIPARGRTGIGGSGYNQCHCNWLVTKRLQTFKHRYGGRCRSASEQHSHRYVVWVFVRWSSHFHLLLDVSCGARKLIRTSLYGNRSLQGHNRTSMSTKTISVVT
jgi:hypothetical protein